MLFASITLLRLDWHLLTFLTSHFQYKKAGFFYLIHYWMQVSTRNWLHTGGINIELRCLEKAWNFQRFLYSQSGLHQWLTWRLLKVNCKMHFLSPYSYFSPCYFISHHSLFLFRWFTKVDALSLQRVIITKLKIWTLQTWFLKTGTSVL